MLWPHRTSIDSKRIIAYLYFVYIQIIKKKICAFYSQKFDKEVPKSDIFICKILKKVHQSMLVTHAGNRYNNIWRQTDNTFLFHHFKQYGAAERISHFALLFVCRCVFVQCFRAAMPYVVWPISKFSFKIIWLCSWIERQQKTYIQFK